jgi:hypothetical protein
MQIAGRLLKQQSVNSGHGQVDQQLQSQVKGVQGLAKGFELMFLRAFASRRVRVAPVGGGGVARPAGADFSGSVVADGDDQSMCGALASANSSQFLLRSPSVEMPALCKTCKASGWGCWLPSGLLPAEKPRNRLPPMWFRTASAKMLRPTLWLHRKRTWMGLSVMAKLSG